MTSAVQTSPALLPVAVDGFEGYKVIPRAAVKVQKVTSIDAFKSNGMDFRSLKPAVMVKDMLIVRDGPAQL